MATCTTGFVCTSDFLHEAQKWPFHGSFTLLCACASETCVWCVCVCVDVHVPPGSLAILNATIAINYTLCAVWAKGYAISHICMCIKLCMSQILISVVWYLSDQNPQKNCLWHSFHIKCVMNVMVNCQFTPGWVLLPFLWLHMCVPLG